MNLTVILHDWTSLSIHDLNRQFWIVSSTVCASSSRPNVLQSRQVHLGPVNRLEKLPNSMRSLMMSYEYLFQKTSSFSCVLAARRFWISRDRFSFSDLISRNLRSRQILETIASLSIARCWDGITYSLKMHASLETCYLKVDKHDHWCHAYA